MRRAFNIQLGKFVSKTGSNLVPEVKHYAVRSALNANRFAIAHRGFSTNTNTQEAATPNDAGKEQKNEIKRLDYDEYDDYEVPNDPKSKVSASSVLRKRFLSFYLPDPILCDHFWKTLIIRRNCWLCWLLRIPIVTNETQSYWLIL